MEMPTSLLDRSASCSDFLSCLFALNATDVSVLFSLSSAKKATLDSIAEITGRDRTTVFRSLERLISAGFVTKTSSVVDGGGGTRNLYSVVSEETLMETIRSRARAAVDNILEAEKRAEEELRRHLYQ
ncbi:MarR family transcriptional regulator [Thermogymnomonas acidicola]|uniref:helix-turn-helix domain-containing protein n=1 Tax=Thermogymnomonas acidicola TaxID=399579 RepID=UPI001396AFDD|nr:helix-turn-helix domain-containing protein [Thermogymnomonas acidicola]